MTITAEAQEQGHEYLMGHVNAYCPKCSTLQVTALTCEFDNDDDEFDDFDDDEDEDMPEDMLRNGDEADVQTFADYEGEPTVTVSLEITNVYELLDDEVVTKATDRVVPAPSCFDDLDEWESEVILPFTGIGFTRGDSSYFVTITASSDPELVGREIEFC